MTATARALAALLAAALLAPAAAQDLLVTNARIVTVVGGEIESGSILVRGGRIAAIGDVAGNQARDIPPERRIDAGGATAYPGIFAPFTQLGMVEVGAVAATNDTDEGKVGANVAQLQAADAYNPLSELIPVTRRTGITTAYVAPSPGNVISGQGFVAQLRGATLEEAVVRNPVALHISLGERPKDRYQSGGPSTRMGLAAFIRGQLIEAQEYRDRWRRHADALARHGKKAADFPQKLAQWQARPPAERGSEPEPPEPPEAPRRDLQKDALVRALDGHVLTVVTAQRLDDIETALRLADEFGLRIAILGGADAWRIASTLAERKVPVLLSPTEQPDSMETQGAVYENAKILHEAGVTIALYAGDTSHNVRNTPFEAAVAVAHGLPRDAALRAITVNPAQIFGLEKDLGGIATGKIANLLIADGDPLDPKTRVQHVIVGGEPMPLGTRQTDLAKKHAGYEVE
jgi:imidazolonepropionase-like amidohydrolase